MAGEVEVNGSAPNLSTHPIHVAEQPKLDLESYISNYDGFTRLRRLYTIGTSSKVLGVDALQLGIQEAKQGRSTKLYEQFVQELAKIAPSDALSRIDETWMDQKEKGSSNEAGRLESELKGYKNNMIKESIRMGNEDLGAFFYEIGDYPSSIKAFSRMREYCTTPKNIAEMALKLVLVGIAQENWVMVQSQVYKIQGLSLKPDDTTRLEPILNALLGLVHMESGQYRAAAHSFMLVNPIYSTLEPIGGINFSRQVASANDIAVYGALCALASMDRTELRTSILDNQTFRSFLELEPHLRRAITDFCNSKYTQSLGSLETFRADYLLDIYLQRHVPTLYAAIRRKSVIAYFKPFSRASISSMATAFKVDQATMELEIVEMIRSGSLNARLDKVEGVVVATTEDKRRAVLEKALLTANEQEKALRIRLWRTNMMNHGFTIKNKNKEARFKMV